MTSSYNLKGVIFSQVVKLRAGFCLNENITSPLRNANLKIGLTSLLPHEPSRETQSGAVINRVNSHVRMPLGFEGVVTNALTHREK